MSHTREGSRDRELVLSRHHQTVPMWDSSDPERAPPPLPLNPGSTSPITKANVSPNIQAVAANFTEKLRDNSPSPYTTNPMTPKSPEKSLIKGQFHKRMQSLQNTDTRSEFLNYLESRSPERPLRASFSEHGPRSPEKAAPMPESPSDQQVSDQETPNLLISNRYLSRPLFGESTPTSATMLALQTMQLPPEHEPEPRIKEPDFPETKHSQPSSLEFLSTQILSLTDIASNLQREMTQLSRRSKDNATDLISLKAATNARDEDIRKSLRDLSSNLASKFLDADGATRWDISALLGSESGINQSELDSSPNSKKSYSVPRMQSPSPFMAAMEREFCASPGPISDGSASIALLEKVLREMATKEGQEKLLELVNELKARPASDDSSKTGDNAVTKMLEEILNIVKQDSGTKALVRSQAAGANKDLDVTDLDEAYASVADVTHPNHTAMNDTRLTEEMMDILKRVRSSVIEGGGMTNEVKALVRELRGEVLGMGRNLARKLEDVEHTRAIEDTPKGPGSAEIAEIVDSSLQELRTQMTSIMNDNKRQSSALTEFRAAMDSAELYSIVKKALDHFGSSQLRNEPDGARMQKEDILEAVREAWETYKPEIELQNFGLERDEILDCLSEGLKAYQPQHEQAVTYDQVLAAVQAGIQQFEQTPTITKDDIVQTIQECLETPQPPRSFDDGQLAAIRDEVLHAVTESMTSQSALTRDSFDSGLGRDEILSAVSDGIEAHMVAAKELEHKPITKEDVASIISDAFSAQQSALTTNGEPPISREEIISAITEGLESQSSIPREIELNKDDLMDAITAGLNEVTANANQGLGDQILERLNAQFESVKDEVKQRPSETGEATEHLVNLIKDSIAIVRQDVEGYVATASEAAGKYEVMDTVKEGFRLLQADLEKTITETSLAHPPGGNPDTPELLDAMEKEFEHLRQTISSLLIRNNTTPEKDEIMDALESLRESVSMSLVPAEQKSEKDEIIAAVQATLEAFHAVDDKAKDVDSKDEIMAALRDFVENHKPDNSEHISTLLQQEFERLRESLMLTIVPAEQKSDKEEIIAAVQATLEAFHEVEGQPKDGVDKDAIMTALREFSESHNPDSAEKISTLFQQEFERLRDSLATSLVPTATTDKDEIIAAVQATLEAFHEVNSQTKDGTERDEIVKSISNLIQEMFDNSEKEKPSSNNEDIISLIQQEFERLHNSLTLSLVPAEPKDDKDEIIAAVQATLEAFHEENNQGKNGSDKDDFLQSISSLIQEKLDISENQKPNSNEDITSLIQQEFERLRDSLTMSIVPAESKDDKDDIVTSVHAALATYYEEKDKAKEGTEAAFPTTELTDAFHDGVGVIREDLAKLLERPVEFDASELLDTLKDGLSSLKAEVESIRQSQVASEEATSSSSRELMLANESSMTNDIEGIKNLISQLQAKVDAIEAAPRAPDIPEDLMRKEHMDEVLLGLHELQTAVTVIAARDFPAEVTLAKKEDTDAIETLLRSTKTQLDEMVFPAPDEIARAEQLGSLEDIVKETKDVVTELYGRLDAECPTKADIGTLETLMKEMWIALDESKTKEGEKEGEVEGETETEKLVKADLQTVEAMIFEVKSQVEELKLPDVETLPTKTEIQDLANLMNEFKEKVEADQELTGQGFEARKIEHAGLAEKIDEARAVVEGLGEELKSKLDGSHDGLSELKQLLEGLAASAESFTTVANVNELTELINREFERARGEQDATKLEKEERDASVLVKHDETKAAIIVELSAKIDERFGEVIAKYDEAQSSTDSKFAEAAERDNQNLEAVANTRALAEDIKLVIGSMGDSVNEACERMSADTKTLLEKVDVSYSKMEEQQQQARSDVERAAAATERVETTMHEFHPKVLESIQEILSIVGQHYNHSQQAAQDLKMDLSILPTTIPQMLPALPAPEPEKYDDSELHTKLNNLLEHSKGTQVQDALNVLIERVTSNQVHEKLDQLLGQTTSTNGQVYDKLSELLDQATASKGPIHEKLDTLIDHATNTTQSVNQMMKLDEMHKDIMETSRKMNEMLASQSALVAEDTERRRREAEEAAVALERRTAQREQIEAEILNLQDEKESMLAMIHRLKAEKDELTAQNAKLNKDVSALETALELRHEEMQVMEERADSLEKRILEGVLDHARTVLLSRPKSVQGLSMKKVRARNMSASSTASTAKDSRSILGSSIGLALKKRAPLASQASSVTTPATPKERRILSLSNVTGNRGLADRQSGTSGGLANLKRSQSVKSNFSYRKSSWGGRSSVANKENEVFPEEDENLSGDESDTGTERRTSYTGTYAGSMTYGPGSVISERHVSNTHDDTSTIARSIDGDENEEDDTIEEKDEDAGSDVEAEVEVEAEAEAEAQAAKDEEPKDLVQQLKEQLDEKSSKMVLYAPPSDSGLGSEITSAAG